MEQPMASAGKADHGEVLALGFEGIQQGDALVDRDLPVGGAIEPQRRNGELLQIALGIGA
jgi:hypothetical protein